MDLKHLWRSSCDETRRPTDGSKACSVLPKGDDADQRAAQLRARKQARRAAAQIHSSDDDYWDYPLVKVLRQADEIFTEDLILVWTESNGRVQARNVRRLLSFLFDKVCDLIVENADGLNQNEDEPDPIEANQDKLDLSEYSPWKTPKEWYELFDVHHSAFRRMKNADPPDIRVCEINSKKWRIHKDDLRRWGVPDLL